MRKLRAHYQWLQIAFAVAWIGVLSLYWIRIKMRDISISFGSRTSTAISAVGGLRDIHLRRCHHRDSLGGAVHLSRNNRQPQSAKALAGAVSDRDCGCSFPKQRNFPQRTTAFASGCIPDLVVAVACGCRYERSGTSRGNCSRNIAISLIDLQSEQRRNVANRALASILTSQVVRVGAP